MRLAVRMASLLALLLSIVWLLYKPGFDSAVAVAASLAALLSSFFLEKTNESGGQTQHISGKSIGIQAGRDAKVDNVERK